MGYFSLAPFFYLVTRIDAFARSRHILRHIAIGNCGQINHMHDWANTRRTRWSQLHFWTPNADDGLPII